MPNATTHENLFAFSNLFIHFSIACRKITLYGPQQHHSLVARYGQNPVTVCLSYPALTLWLLGYPDQARLRAHDMHSMAQELAHPHGLVRALAMTAMLSGFYQEWEVMQDQAEAAIRISSEQGFELWRAIGSILWGRALAGRGQVEDALDRLREGLAAYRATGATMLEPHFRALLAEACRRNGQTKEGLAMIGEGLDLADKTGERWWEAELHRLRGELLRMAKCGWQNEGLTPETCFQTALDLARHQQAKSLELRAATSLARLWQQQGKRQNAYELLASVYNSFTEGFDTADLKEAKRLLAELA